eukprot:GHVT01061581.1.p1 GENE.GHVT01061581.1~~GHVT01061581.1.p1  ORF type:complete len:202 (-),score=35.56 GHVT01061581.1:471-1076(-)
MAMRLPRLRLWAFLGLWLVALEVGQDEVERIRGWPVGVAAGPATGVGPGPGAAGGSTGRDEISNKQPDERSTWKASADGPHELMKTSSSLPINFKWDYTRVKQEKTRPEVDHAGVPLNLPEVVFDSKMGINKESVAWDVTTKENTCYLLFNFAKAATYGDVQRVRREWYELPATQLRKNPIRVAINPRWRLVYIHYWESME